MLITMYNNVLSTFCNQNRECVKYAEQYMSTMSLKGKSISPSSCVQFNVITSQIYARLHGLNNNKSNEIQIWSP